MAGKIKTRDKFFWICLGFGGVIAVYFLYNYFVPGKKDLASFTAYNYRKEFSIYVPQYLLPADSIYAGASLQFSDFSHEVFLVVVKETKSELKDQGLMPTLPEYSSYIQTSIETAMKNSRTTAEKNTIINEMPSVTKEIEGEYGGKYIYYIFTVYESDTYFFQVISWTTTTIKPEVKKDIYTAMRSFSSPAG